MDLSSNALALFNYLASCAEDFDPSKKQVCKILKLSRPTIYKVYKELEIHNIVRKYSRGGNHRTTKYEFINPKEWKK